MLTLPCPSLNPRLPRVRRRPLWAAIAFSLLATLIAVPAAPASASQRPNAPSNLEAASTVFGYRNAQNEIVYETISYARWDLPAERRNITCYYIRWRVAAKDGQVAGAWQPSEQGVIAPYADYYGIDGLTIGETYDFEVRSYSEQLGAYSEWVTLTKTMTQASTDSSLSSLTLSSGTLSPEFKPEEWGGVTYTATVPNSVESITFTPTANDENATISYKGTEIASGSASNAISLAVGPNYFEIDVVAEYGSYWRSYTVNVVRAAAAQALAAPTGLTLAQDAADNKHRITLTWTLPTGATEAVLQYRQVAHEVQWSSSGVIDLTTTGGKIHAKLRDNIDYAVRVAGKNDSGIGAWATATFIPHTQPYWPLNVLAASGDESLVVSWDPPVDKGAPDAVITSYSVRWRPLPEDPCCPWSQPQGTDVGDVQTYTITGLTNDQPYEVQVVAFNNLGRGTWSQPIQGTPAEMQGSPPQQQVLGGSGDPDTDADTDPDDQESAPEPLTKPGAVSDVQATIDGSKVTVTWSPPQEGGAPSQYVVRMKTPKKGKAKIKRVDADTTSVTFGKVKAGAHTVFVRAKNATGGGKWTKTQITVP